jgi:C1A family cysteine protease
LYERANDFNECIDALNNGYPVIIGFDVYSSFITNSVSRTGMMPYPNTSRESLLGGHAVLIVGYNNATQRFTVRNSWGTSWGDKGYFYMPYQVIQNSRMSGDFWVIKSVTNP